MVIWRKIDRRVWCLTARTHTTLIPFLVYNCSFSSILCGRCINFADSCFNTENYKLRFIARVASDSPKHCFSKNLYRLLHVKTQLLLANPLINILCEVIFSR